MKEITLSASHMRHNLSSLNASLVHSRQEERLHRPHSNTNIKLDRTSQYNVNIFDRTTEQMINDVFEESRLRYNELQPQRSRRISNVLDKITSDKRNSEPFHEFVFAYGSSMDLLRSDVKMYINSDSVDTEIEEWNVRNESLKELAQSLPDMFPAFQFINIELHQDESNPHIHATFLPVVDAPGKFNKSVSFTGALVDTCNNHGVTLPRKKNGEVDSRGAYRAMTEDIIKPEMLRIYNTKSKEKAKRAPSREARKALTEKEFKRIVKPLQDLYLEMYDTHNTLITLLDKCHDIIAEKMVDDLELLDETIERAKDTMETFESMIGPVREFDVNSINLDEIIGETSNSGIIR